MPFIGAALNGKPQCCPGSKHNFFSKVNDKTGDAKGLRTEASSKCKLPRPAFLIYAAAPLSALASGRCSYHPDRPGLGICVECRSVICQECTTQFEGINRCASCLSARTRKPAKVQVYREFSAANVALATFSFGLLFTGFWLLALLAQSTHGH